MKRLLWFLPVLLLLCGCTVQPPEETTIQPPETTGIVTQPTVPAGIYEPFSDLELQTAGAIRCYLPNLPDAYGMRIINGDVLIFSGAEQTTLTRYTGDTLIPVGQITLDCRIYPEDSSFQTGENGITYFDPADNSLVYLGRDLQEVSRLKLPEELVGRPVISSDRTLVYYCTADAVRVYDTGTGLDRLLKSISYSEQTVTGVLMNNSILHCILTDTDGEKNSLFLSAQTGELILQTRQVQNLSDRDGRWFLEAEDGLLKQVVFGEKDGPVQALYPEDLFAPFWILDSQGSVVTASMDGEAMKLSCYDLESGTRSAAVELPGTVAPRYIVGTPEGERVYVLAHDEIIGGPVVLRWDLNADMLLDDLTYTGPRYTARNPDEAGLAECAARAGIIGEKYGVNILIGPEAAAVRPEDYVLKQEHQVQLIHRELEVLDQALSQFPEGFFDRLYGGVNICILRSITGNAQTGSVDQARGIQFWDGENAYIALAAGENLYKTFFHEIFHIIDSKVLSTTRVYYHWENLNPEGCKYFQDFTSYLTADVSQYLEEENRAFIDAYSLCYPREDRARIMEYACTEGNEAYFTSEIMQNKLKTLCQGIRKAFGLEKYQEPLIWEQYLKEMNP